MKKTTRLRVCISIIPILVLVFFAWLVKTILSVNLGAAGTPAKLE